MENKIGKTVNLELKGIEKNSFSLMGRFTIQARSEEWTWEEIDSVFEEANCKDYEHLLLTIKRYCEPKV